ncbi:putative pilus assembly protein [Pseudomonas sp. ATCC 13867]|uniref:TadE/TadG family type IV pilus assembly protein n=1 Tax=Pseudomonas sp. ATCC 13867 TaxID=1294143 RepID=UPI0002C4DE06|nr:TadE/TadG family type IV pilus assembly protein [Pseudomonas sp. ATCC 13867]AGI23055.1 putative pilus assembly protein [Pseudomonas sp. ATCC 13867]RFQ26257.1 pilus assembly protein [Pseudomonas sp. ATCC 13867]
MKGIGSSQGQRGAVAIEFAAVFVLFFAVLYGLLGYCVPLLMLQAFNDAAASGARIAISVNPQADNYETQLHQVVTDEVDKRLAWMPDAWHQGCYGGSYLEDAPLPTETIGEEERVYTRINVCVSYPYMASPIVPLLTLPGIGTIPRLPDVLKGKATLLF